MPEHYKLLLKMSQEPLYLRYEPMNIAVRTLPGAELTVTVYVKNKGKPEHLLPRPMEIMKTAIKDCVEISKEEYDIF